MNKKSPVEPCPIEWMGIVKDEPNTICHVLREIYRDTTDEKIRLKCRIAMAMAKKIVNKLREYKNGVQK